MNTATDLRDANSTQARSAADWLARAMNATCCLGCGCRVFQVCMGDQECADCGLPRGDEPNDESINDSLDRLHYLRTGER